MDWAGKGSSCLPETGQEGRHNGRKGSGTSALEAHLLSPCHSEPLLENSMIPWLSPFPLPALGQSGGCIGKCLNRILPLSQKTFPGNISM